jgi:hypothetical protein
MKNIDTIIPIGSDFILASEIAAIGIYESDGKCVFIGFKGSDDVLTYTFETKEAAAQLLSTIKDQWIEALSHAASAS